MTTFHGERGVDTFRAITIKSGLNLYAKTGMRPNRHWTPTKMLAAAGEITGKKFKRGQYAQAAEALQEWLDTNGGNGGY